MEPVTKTTTDDRIAAIGQRLAELPPEVLDPVAQAVAALLDAVDAVRQ